MPATYLGHGLRFLYPENWQLDEEESDGAWSVHVQSPSTGYVQIIGHESRPAVDEVLASTLSALREDYPELEEEAAGERIAGHRAQGRDVRFISLDLTATCWLRCFRTPHATVLVLCQVHDLESAEFEPIFRAMRQSLALAD